MVNLTTDEDSCEALVLDMYHPSSLAYLTRVL